MQKFIMMVGLCASGKDTWANRYVRQHSNTIIHSSDDIRAELYGDASIQGTPAEIFNIMKVRSIRSLREGYDVIYNATNIAYKDRKSIITTVRSNFKDEVEIICVIMATPLTICKEWSQARERTVPDYVYDKMLRRWQTPCYWEGFDSIVVVYSAGKEDVNKYVDMMRGFDQKNHHHTYDLYTHCQKSVEHMDISCFDSAIASVVKYSLKLHDIGKVFTQTGPDENGDYHYYNHENVGAYILLCLGSLFGSQLTTWHMLPYMKDEKGIATWKKRMGIYFTHWLAIFHECDVAGH